MSAVMGLVLAGGRSSRMGTDKACLTLGNLRLIDVVVRKLLPLCEAGVWIGGRDYGYPWLSDLETIKGPMASIARLGDFSNKNISSFFIIPVDMPFFEDKDFRYLSQQLSEEPSLEAVCFEQSHFPLLLKNTSRLVLVIEEWITSRSSDSVHSFLALLNLARVQSKALSNEAFVNLNYPADYLQHAAQLGGVLK